MSQQPITPDIDDADEELVAYLDGELDAGNRDQVERRLADDAAFRARLRLLQRTWDALDVLGRADVGEQFTRTTVELVAVKAAEEIVREQSRQSQKRTWTWIGWTATAIAAMAAGWLIIAHFLDRPNQQLLRDLAVIERVDEYRNADSFEFVKALEESGLFAAELESDLLTVSAPSGDETGKDRAARVASLKPEDKARLVQRNERFLALAPPDRDKLRQLHEQIARDPAARRLLSVLDRYSQWLKALGPTQQAELVGLPLDERLVKIKEIQQLQVQMHFWELAGRLEKEDLDTINAWMEDYVLRNQDAIVAKADPNLAMGILSATDYYVRRGLLLRAVFGRGAPGNTAQLNLTGDDFRSLASRLSPTLKFHLTEQKSDEDRRDLLMTCARFAYMSRFAPPAPKDEELSRFYASLEPAEREQVDRLEPQQMKRELTKLYRAKRYREGRGRPPAKGGFGPPPDGPASPARETGGKGQSSPPEKT